MYGVNSVQDILFRYPADCLMYLFSLIAIMFFLYKASPRGRAVYGLLCFFAVLFIFNPVCFNIVSYFNLRDTYYRFIWAIPLMFMVAVFLVKMVKTCSDRFVKLAIIFIFFVCVISGRTFDEVGRHLSDKDNIYGFRDDIIDISNIIEADAEKSEPTVLTDEYVFSRLRCYNANIVYKVSREYYLNDRRGEQGYYTEDGTGNPALVRMEQLGEQTDEETMRAILAELQVDYIIIKSEFDMGGYLNKFNYVLLGTTDIYEVYKVGTEG